MLQTRCYPIAAINTGAGGHLTCQLHRQPQNVHGRYSVAEAPGLELYLCQLPEDTMSFFSRNELRYDILAQYGV